MRQARRPVVWITMVVAMVVLLGIASGYLLLGGSKKNIEEGASLRLSAGAPSFDTPAAVLEQAPGDEVTTSQITQALNGRIDRPEFGALNICIVDAITGDELFNDSGNMPAVPASTTKIATAYAVLSALDPEKRLSTRVIAGSAPGEIVLISDGDPTLAASAQGFYPGAGRLDELAKQIEVTTPITRIIVHTGPFSGPSAGPSWPSEAIGSNYVNPITPVAVDAGRREPDTETRVSEPDIAAGRALASALGVPQAQVIRGEAATNTEVLGEVHSPTIRRLVEVMLEESDNVLAEALARQVAIAQGLPASFEGGAAATERVLAEDNFVVNVSDGSGLSLDNRISPAALVAILQKSINDPKYSPIASGMPVGSYSGTLYTRFNDPNEQAAAGKIRAKTGTLNSVSSLAGFVTTAGGRVLSFAAIANGYPEGADEPARNALDELSAALAQLK